MQLALGRCFNCWLIDWLIYASLANVVFFSDVSSSATSRQELTIVHLYKKVNTYICRNKMKKWNVLLRSKSKKNWERIFKNGIILIPPLSAPVWAVPAPLDGRGRRKPSQLVRDPDALRVRHGRPGTRSGRTGDQVSNFSFGLQEKLRK